MANYNIKLSLIFSLLIINIFNVFVYADVADIPEVEPSGLLQVVLLVVAAVGAAIALLFKQNQK